MSARPLQWSCLKVDRSRDSRYACGECLRCSKPFFARKADIKRGKGKYCSMDCANRAIGDNQRGKPRPGANSRNQTGPANPNWKGGVTQDHMRYKRRFVRKNPEKVRAHRIVMGAIRSGKLIRPDACSRCGSGIRIAGHHDDYSKPLEVIWLCQPCHNRHHAWLRVQQQDPDATQARSA